MSERDCIIHFPFKSHICYVGCNYLIEYTREQENLIDGLGKKLGN